MTGGYDDANDNDGSIDYFSSTELLVKGDTQWKIVHDSLPARMSSLRSISINNQIITTGEY